MRLLVPALAIALAAGAFAAERHKLEVDAETDDGILLQHIQQEPLPERKLALLEKYAAQFSKTVSIAWVYDQLIGIYAASQSFDKITAVAGALLDLDPGDLDTANAALRAAEALKDRGLIRQQASRAWEAAQITLKSPPPPPGEALSEWTQQCQAARSVIAYTEYLLYVQIKQAPDAKEKMELMQALEKRNPRSPYLEAAKQEYFNAYQQGASPEQTIALAEKDLAADPDNEDLLMTVARYYMQRERDLPRVLSCSLRVIEILQRKQPPDGAAPEAWSKKKADYAAMASWMAGVVYAKQGKYAPSERYLRAALPYARDKGPMLAAALYYLGYDNYALGGELQDRARLQEAVRYNKQCAAIEGPFQALAAKNLDVIRSEFNVQ